MMIQEFQHSVEFQVIRVMTHTMRLIQFKSLSMLIQTKMIELLGNRQNGKQFDVMLRSCAFAASKQHGK
jgi:ubiquinone biosynthesis protein UbiJ